MSDVKNTEWDDKYFHDQVKQFFFLSFLLSWNRLLYNSCYKLIALTFALLQSSSYDLHKYLKVNFETNFTESPPPNEDKNDCGDCV